MMNITDMSTIFRGTTWCLMFTLIVMSLQSTAIRTFQTFTVAIDID